MKLRKYQRETIDAVTNAWDRGVNNALAVLATGGGKTIIFLQLISEMLEVNPNARFLIVAHRKELIEQPIERLGEFWPQHANKTGIVMASQNAANAQIIVATVQTLAQSEGRLDEILQHGQIDYLIIDEAHHSYADSYLGIINRLQEANLNLKHLGVTATPVRADSGKLPYDEKVVHMGVKELVRDEWLAPPRWLAIQTGISLVSVAVYGSGENRDYSKKGLVDVFETDNCFELVAESHLKYAAGRKALAFAVSVEGAYNLAEKFNDIGIKAIAADGTTDKRKRSQILRDFRDGHYEVLCNVGLYTEGLDVPEVSCIHQVRPTRSDSLYLQMIGRGLRKYPAKDDCLILDYAPAEARNITMLGDVLGVKVRKDAYISEDAGQGEMMAGFLFDGEFKWSSGDPMEIISRKLDYLNMSPWKWEGEKYDWITLGLGKNDDDDIDRTLAISPPSEEMQLWGIAREPEKWAKAYKLRTGDFEYIQEEAEEFCVKWGAGIISSKSARWRKTPPSSVQIKFATQLGLDVNGQTKGRLATAITHKLAIDALRRAGALSR